MNRLEFVAKQISSARASSPSLADRGIKVVKVPAVLSLGRRRRLLNAINAANSDPSVTFIAFVGGSGVLGEYFCQGADETEFASSEVAIPLGTRGKQIQRPKDLPRDEAFFQSPTVSEIVEVIDACDKVTVAVVSGQCLAEGAELILACDYRIATRTATFGFDQIKTLGLIPCAGGTQRLPRAVGIQQAVHWITSGKIVSATIAADKGLIDLIVSPSDMTPVFASDELLVDAAITQLSVSRGPTYNAIAKRRLSKTMGKIPNPITANILEAICRRDLMQRMPKGFDAPSHALRAIMGYSGSDFSVGLKNERAVFEEVYDSAQSHAMRHLSMAKARAAFGPASVAMSDKHWSSGASNASGAPSHPLEDPTISAANIKSIGIIGGGVMGSAIAACFLAAGIKVIVVDINAEVLGKCPQRIAHIYKPLIDRGRITRRQQEERLANLTIIGGHEYHNALVDVDIAIEAIYEDQALKQEVFRTLDKCCKASCIIASNTATVDINSLASVTERPSQVVGIHFFSPAHLMQLVEIVKGAATSDATVMRLLALTQRIHKIGVVVGNAFGFVSNRLAIRGVFQAVCCVEDGAFPYQIDDYLKDFGFANGVFEMQDIAGLDVAAQLLAVMPPEHKMGRSVSTIPRELMASGRLGIKAGKGWYRYDPEEPTKPKSDLTVERLCIATSAKKGIKRRTIPKKEATYRFLFHIINEAALLLENGVAVRPSDIDLIFVLGFGFPYFRGGPLYVADQIGIENVIEKMQMFAATCGRDTFPAPCKFLVDMAKNKKRFSDFNQ